MASSTSAINQTMIGYGTDGQANNSVTLGNSDVTAVYMAEDSGATVYAAGLNLGSTAVTSTAAELNYVDGVTSNVQTQLDSKLSSSGNITTGGNIIIPDSGNIGSTSDTDAITIANSGNVTFGQDVTVNGDVVISSDARLKSNIVSLGSTLPKLLQIDGKSYEMKGKQKIGVLAQEIQEVFPELVSEDDNEMLAVNYQGLVPVLINALKEQDKIIKSQEERLTNIENLIANLND